MKDELLEKIQHVLDRPIRNEMQVVYLLVELRKLQDRAKYKNPVLRTFSNWVVHTDLQYPQEGSTRILTEFDELMANIYEHHKGISYRTHLGLQQFRVSLIDCFKHFGLSATFTTDGVEWKKFCQQYCLIVSECPIVFKASTVELKYVRQVELHRVTPGPIVKDLPVVGWKVTLKTGRTMNWGFHMG